MSLLKNGLGPQTRRNHRTKRSSNFSFSENQPSGQYQVCMRPVSADLLEDPSEFAFKPVAVTVDERNCGGPGGKCCPFTIASQGGFPFKPKAPPAQ